MGYLIYFIVLAIGFTIGRVSSPSSGQPATKAELETMRYEARQAISARTADRATKILALMQYEAEHQRQLARCSIEDKQKGITRQDVEDLLGVSGATANKYLNELEKAGKIEQIGASGPNVYYLLK